jgi:CheY-like chemotaxis protein
MLGWSRMLLADSRDRVKLERGLTVIERNARAQARLVDDLMDVSRIVSGKLHLSMRRVHVSTVIHAAADVIRATAESKGVRLVVDLDPEIGATVADPDRLQQIVWNLLSNAVRFTPARGRVRVTAQRTASTIAIDVEDTGTGIAPEHLPHIFERFRQVDSTTTRAHGGLGLGLAIVRHLVEAHGGSVSANSAGLGAGARFTVLLPISAVSMQAGSAPDGGPAPAFDGVGTGGPAERGIRLDDVHVLVIEDELDSRELLRLVLEGAGARVTATGSAREALDALGPFDIILSDIGMPEMDGYALLRRLREQPAGAGAPALALTAYARAEDAERALRAGYQEHIAKPVDSSMLIDAVRRWIGAFVDPGTRP